MAVTHSPATEFQFVSETEITSDQELLGPTGDGQPSDKTATSVDQLS
jgi:hypothetical protein